MFFPQPQVGAVRMTQWATWLPHFGWDVTVMCQDFGHRASAEQVEKELGPNIEINYFNKHQPSGAVKNRVAVKQWFQRHLGIQQWWVPDRSIRLWKKYRPKILETIDRVKPDVVLTSSPTHSIHDIGRFLKRERKVKWVADFRDPWMIDKRFQPKGIGTLLWKKHLAFEADVYRQADGITCAIPVHSRWIAAKFPEVRAHLRFIPNGIPEELISGQLEPIKSAANTKSIRIIGNPGGDLINSVADAVVRICNSGTNCELCLVGPEPPQKADLENRMGDRLKVIGPVTHKEALKYILGADLLVCPLASNREQSLLLSSKLFEYLATGVPIVVINPSKPDRLFFGKRPEITMTQNSQASELEKIFSVSLQRANNKPVQFIKEFGRRSQTQHLAEFLDKTVGTFDPDNSVWSK
jgi:glycosyltransferase involved in cell wall biosynthesis